MIRLATAEGLIRLDPEAVSGAREVSLEGQGIRALGGRWVVLDDGLVARADGSGMPVKVDGLVPWCVSEVPEAGGAGAFVGTSEARLFHVADFGGGAVPVESFDRIPTRDEWYTPWGGPPDTRSLAVTLDGDVLVNVHVGGIWSGRPDGEWDAVVDVDADVHQVVADRDGPAVVAAAAIGCGVSLDGGHTWNWSDDGLHASYCRAVAIAGDVVLVSASTGPSTRAGALYRRGLGSDRPFERCGAGLPESFPFNLDTFTVAALDDEAVLGTGDGRLFRSTDQGSTWDLVAGDLPAVRAVDVEDEGT